MIGKQHAKYIPLNNNALRLVVDRLAAAIRESGIQFDGIAGRGISGVIVIPSLALALDKPFAIVRKESSHSPLTAEVGGDMERYLFVDDLIDTGTTLDVVMETLSGAKCVGIFLYASRRTDPAYLIPVKGIGVLSDAGIL